MRERTQIGHRTALGKASEKDALTGDAALDLACNEGTDDRARSEQPGFVNFAALAAERDDVVPGGHDVAAIAGHGLQRCVGEDEAQRGRGRKPQFGHDGFEVAAIGTQAVQPDHRC